jgi:hypothetical protein
MGILAAFFFLILILTIGFYYNNWTLSFMIFVFLAVFGVMLAQSSIEEVMREWPKRRCDFEVLIASQLYKPKDDTRSAGEFAADNFQFCVKKTFREILTLVLSPVFAMMNSQLNVMDAVNNALDRFRIMIATLFDRFLKILDPFFKRFRMTGNQFAVNQLKILTAMGRAFGIAQATLYIGMSLVVAIENFIKFVIRVIMIIMYVILGLMIFIWYLILPVFALIIVTCQLIGNSPFGYLVEDVCGELCFDPETNVLLENGVVQKITNCKIGDIFEDGTVIEGILRVSGEKEPMYSLDGIRVSGAHLVWHIDEWIPVAEHPEAVPSFYSSPLLICLRTSNRTIPLEGLRSSWTFRDWEELPMNLPTSDTIWDFLVAEILNEKPTQQPPPQEIPLLKSTCKIMHKTGELRALSEVQIGDFIYCAEGFTKVTGIYIGQAEFSSEITDGIWIQQLGESDWHHPTLPQTKSNVEKGFHLTTESGTFWIETKNISGFVRDFTEVGVHNLSLTYSFTRKLLKKSLSREESCVSDSLSQASLFCSQLTF